MKNQTEKSGRRYLVFINMGFQMGVCIGLGVLAGIGLDKKFPNTYSLYTIIGALLGVFVALYLVYRSVKNLSKD